jgi:hypothetical protein
MHETEDKHCRRSFFKQTAKYFVGFGAFTIASIFGLRRDGEIKLGKMRKSEFGLSEASGKCGNSYDCSGGGGNCGNSYNCSGGGGKCGNSYNCAGE